MICFHRVVWFISVLPVMCDIKLSESERRLQEAYNKHEVLTHTLTDKQTMCDMLQSHVDVSLAESAIFVLTALCFLFVSAFHIALFFMSNIFSVSCFDAVDWANNGALVPESFYLWAQEGLMCADIVCTKVPWYRRYLLAGAPRYQLDRLQSVLNTAARLLVGAKKHDRIRHVLRDRLHWLPVQQRVQFKLCLLTFKALHGLAPTYLADLCQPVGSVGSRQRLRSATRGDLVISPTITHFGARSFAVAGPKAWNQFPADIRAIDSVNSSKNAL